MSEPINPFITNFLGPIILIGIILIGYGVMTGQNISKLLGSFANLIGSCLMLIISVLQQVLSIVGKILVHFLKGIGKQVDHTLKQQSNSQNNAVPNTQSTKPTDTKNFPTDSSAPNKPPGPSASSGDIKIIYDNDPDDD